jgi:hypothetical protein
MTTAPAAGRSRTRWIAALVGLLLVVIVVITVIVLVTGDDSDQTVPPLTTTQRQSGVLRVTYPDRSLPDKPTVATVSGQRVTLYLDSVEGTSDGPKVVLRVGVGDSPPTQVTLTQGESTTVKGIEVTAVAVYDTGEASTEAADVTVNAP